MSHKHDEETQRKIVNRLSRVIGHLEAVKNMVINDEDCSDVLIQLSAVKSAVNNTGKIILKEHINHCVVEAIQNGDMETIRKLEQAIDTFIK